MAAAQSFAEVLAANKSQHLLDENAVFFDILGRYLVSRALN